MNKKKYQAPAIIMVKVQVSAILGSASVTSVDNNAGLQYSGGGNDDARSRAGRGWRDDEE